MDISIHRDRELHVSCKWKSCGVLYRYFLTTAVLGQPLYCFSSLTVNRYIYIYIYAIIYIYKLFYIILLLLYSYIVIFIYSYIYVSTFRQTRYCLCHYLWRVFSTQRTVQNGSQPFIWHVWERFRTVLGSRKSENGSERFRTVPELSCSDRPGWQERFRTVFAMAGLVLCFKNRL